MFQGVESTTSLAAPHVINTSIGMCDIDIRPVSSLIQCSRVDLFMRVRASVNRKEKNVLLALDFLTLLTKLTHPKGSKGLDQKCEIYWNLPS